MNCTEADLRAAMAGGGTVTFSCSGTIVLNDTLVVEQDTVFLANAQDVTISGGSAVRILQINTNVSCTLIGIKLTQGRHVGSTGGSTTNPAPPGGTGQGAGILNLGGHLALSDCLLEDNYVEGGFGGNSKFPAMGGNGLGGGICNLEGEVRMTNCVLRGNAARGGRGSSDPFASNGGGNAGHGLGGAIYSVGGSIYLSAVAFTTNQSHGGEANVGAIVDTYTRAGDARGGALYAASASLVIEDCHWTSNAAVGESLPFSGAGAGWASGGALYLTNTVSTLVLRSSFLGNLCRGGGSPRFARGGIASGGAIHSLGPLTVRASTFSTNSGTGGSSITTGPGWGGAIYSGSDCIVTESTFDHNSATGARAPSVSLGGWPGTNGAGGAIFSRGLLNITNCTFASNRAAGGQSAPPNGNPATPGGSGMGGALHIQEGGANLVNLTIAQNEVEAGASIDMGPPTGAALGGGINNASGTVTLGNSVLDLNAPANAAGTITDGAYNLSSDSTPPLSAIGSSNGVNPLLGPLANNGGPTETMALGAGSPAIDIIPMGAPLTDQRGEPRPQGVGSDAGAFEVSSDTLVLNVEMAGNDIVISFTAQEGAHYRLHGSSDLTHWSVMDSKTAVTSGRMEFVSPASQSIFFQVSSP